MTPDETHDFPYQLRNAQDRLNMDARVRAQDRRLIQAFLKHLQA